MAEQVWLIEARFKSMGDGPWIVQRLPPLMSDEEAAIEVVRLTHRNTLSEWRAVPYEPVAPEAEPRKEETCDKPSDATGEAWTCNLPKNHGGECSPLTLDELDDLATPAQGTIAEPLAVPPAQEEACKCPLGCECHHHAQPSSQPAGAEPVTIRKWEIELGDDAFSAKPDVSGEWCRFDEVEAQLAALRKSQQECVEALKRELRTKADTTYCDYVAQMRRTECLGFEAKLKDGTFGRRELTAHTIAATLLGRHQAFAEVAAALANAAKLEGK